MYHNDTSPGYVRMAEGTTAPRQYKDPIYCVLLPHAAHDFERFLSKNGVVLIYDNVPPQYLKIVDQLPTMASNVLRPGRGHMLSQTVTGGTWPSDITYEHVEKENGVGFAPGGEILDSIRTTAWSFIGQATPPNYGKLVFGLLLSTRDDFDPSSESTHGLLSGSSCQKEAPDKDDEPMNDSYTQPSSHTARGSSQQREEPQQDTSAERWWEDHRSSPGSPDPDQLEEAEGDAEEQQEPYFEEEDHVQEEAAALWATEDQLEDDFSNDQATSSVSATNPLGLLMKLVSFAQD